MPAISILDARRQPESVQACIAQAAEAGWFDYGLYRQLGPYWHRVLPHPCADLSAVALAGDRAVAYALANDAHDCVGYFGRPINIVLAPGHRDAEGEIAEALFLHFERLAGDMRRPCRLVRAGSEPDRLSSLGTRVLGSGGSIVQQYRAVVDLTLGEDEIWRGVRKSYRSLINWGRKNLETSIHVGVGAREQDFDEFRELHAFVSGRVTRPRASWDEMLKNAIDGRAELIAGRFDGRLVAATFVNYSKELASYATGVYDRTLFDKPISHWPVYLSILRAKQRGCRIFDLGEVFLDRSRSAKELNIGYFKKGFSDTVEVHTIYQLKPSAGASCAPEQPEAETKAEDHAAE